MNSKYIKNVIILTVLIIIILSSLYIFISKIQIDKNIVISKKELIYPPSEYYSEGDVIELPVSSSYSIIADSDKTFIIGDKNLLIYLKDRTLLKNIDLGSKPYSICFSDSSGLYISFKDKIDLYSRSGEYQNSVVLLDKDSYISSMVVLNNYLFAADVIGKKIIKIKLGDNSIKKYYRYDGKKFIIPSPHFEVIKGVGNTIWITDPGRRKVLQFDVDFNLISSFGESGFDLDGFPGCCNPIHIGITNRGDIITGEKGSPRIKLYSSLGVLGDVILSPSGLTNGAIIDLFIDEVNTTHLLEKNRWRIFYETN